MREYRFRGKRLDTGEWVYGYGVIYGEHYDAETDNEREASIFVEYDKASGLNFQLVEVDPKTVGQYIGKQDMRGKEIYRGDIVRSPDNGEYSFTAVVEWADYGWYMEGIEPVDNFSFDDTEAHELEVVGTRYDTPNPLEATSNE